MRAAAPTIAVLVSAGRNPVSGSPRASPQDAAALELARKLAGEAITVLHAGTADEPALAGYLALGARSVEVVSVPEGGDILDALASRLGGIGLVLTGLRAEHGAGSGVLPYALARRLGCPVVTNVLSLRILDGEAEVRQFLPKGRRRTLAVRLPAVLAVHPTAAAGATYAYARRQSGRIFAALPPPAPQSSVSAAAPVWQPLEAARQPVRLRAAERRSAHARLQAAIASEAKGGTVIADGSSEEKAQAILDYLRANGLVDF